jgi:hypothetical protein
LLASLFWYLAYYWLYSFSDFPLLGLFRVFSDFDVRAQATTIRQQTKAPQTRDFPGAGNSSLPNLISMALIYRDPIDQAQT